ncbi:MAG: hypothetical protein N4A35_10170 [Flavobacteriales bacterium]|jgi:hypothetical protein|nr:hypothetical protein [Flavobacteriales bacterium]
MKLEQQTEIGIGKVVKDDFIDIALPIENQIDNLYEDMFHLVSFDEKFVMDIGWYDGDIVGFYIYIIENEDWETPVLKLVNKSINGFLKDLKKANDKWSELLLSKS